METSERSTETDRLEAWLSARRNHVTSTDLASILCLDDAYGSPIDVWMDKRGLAQRSALLPEWLEWGHRLQSAILGGYAQRVGQPIEEIDPYTLFEVPGFPLLAASLDGRWATGDRRCVDAKNVAFLPADKWGDEFTDRMPQRFYVQLQAQMMATETNVADLAVLAGGNRMRIYRAHADEALQGFLRDAAGHFWRSYVETGLEPPIDGSEGWTRYLATRGQATEIVLASTPQVDDWARGLRAVQQQIARLEELEALAKNTLRAAIGDHAGLQGPWGRISYRQNKAKVALDKDAYIAGLEAIIARGRAKKPKAEAEALRATLTTNKPGDRPLRPVWKDEPEAQTVDVSALTALTALPALPEAESP